MKEKSIVHYKESGIDIRLGYPAFVFPKDHPSKLVSNTCVVRTTKVIRHEKETGEFETENTIYVLSK